MADFAQYICVVFDELIRTENTLRMNIRHSLLYLMHKKSPLHNHGEGAFWCILCIYVVNFLLTKKPMAIIKIKMAGMPSDGINNATPSLVGSPTSIDTGSSVGIGV